MGMDWHSSGITTSVLGALKRGLAPVQDELGLYVCGGRGRHSRRTLDELRRLGDRHGLDGDSLIRASRLVAKVDAGQSTDYAQPSIADYDEQRAKQLGSPILRGPRPALVLRWQNQSSTEARDGHDPDR